MNKKEVLKGNKLIAKFMGEKTKDDLHTEIWFDELWKYYSSWDWLMPVVDKIETLYDGGIDVGIHFGSTIIDQCRDTDKGQLHNPVTLFEITMSEGYDFENKIEFTYEAVTQFIKWHNSINQKKGGSIMYL